MEKSIDKKKLLTYILLFVVLLITAISFIPSLYNGFTNWDDGRYVTENPLIRDLSLENTGRIFSSLHHNMYKPLTLLSYSIEYHFFKLDPLGYHTTNLLFHLLNCVLVFWLIFILSKNSWVAFITAALFGIHPLHVESVAW